MTYIIAEIGSNHNGSMAIAKKLIDEAQRAGASAVKFQAWTPESLYAKSWLADNPDAYNDLRKYSLSIKKLRYLANYADIDFICSVFCRQEVDDLVDTCDLFKIASMDLTNTRLLKHVASKKKPTILSCGMSDFGEIKQAVKIFEGMPLTLLHCVSLYPTENDQVDLFNLERLRVMNRVLPVNIGYSDHTTGITACLAAVALGAVCIEKHFTLDKTQEGWDHHISADPQELYALVKQAQAIKEMLTPSVGLPDIEQRKTMRRSMVASKDLEAGHELTEEDVIWRRPGTGLQELGTLTVNVAKGQLLNETDTR